MKKKKTHWNEEYITGGWFVQRQLGAIFVSVVAAKRVEETSSAMIQI